MKTRNRHASEHEFALWIWMAILLAVTLIAGYLLSMKLAL